MGDLIVFVVLWATAPLAAFGNGPLQPTGSAYAYGVQVTYTVM